MNMEKYDKNMSKSNSKVGQSSSSDENTSLADFKSPKVKKIRTLQQFNFKIETNKKKDKKLKSKSNKGLNTKASTSNQLNKNIFQVSKQTESSMSMENKEPETLSNSVKSLYMCPLCFKSFKDTNTKTLHMKTCASKNNVSTNKLLQAIELQERQSAERASLGLPTAPVFKNKKQTTINRKVPSEDRQLELALVLSKSLYEVEEAGCFYEVEEAGCSYEIEKAGCSYEVEKTIKSNEVETVVEICPSKNSIMELKDKGPIETSRNQKKKKSNFVTVLQTRTKEDRDRLITEKLVEILVNNQTFNQSQQQQETEREDFKKNLKSRLLKKCLDFEIENDNHQSMIIENNDITNETESKDLLPTTSDLCLNKKESTNISPKSDVKLSSKTEKENISIQSSINTLILDWGNALNNSSSSDTIIFVNDGKHIWVHKLVFYIRCSNILLDITPNNNTTYSVKEMIKWADIKYDIALAFLEFIYCGIIKKYAITLTDKIAMSSLGSLARKYKVKELFTYLRHECAVLHDKTSENYEFELDDLDIQEVCNNEDVNCVNQSSPNISQLDISHEELLKAIMTSPKKNTKFDSHLDRENSMSPDIFNDTNDDVQVNNTNVDNLNKNLDILLSPIQSNSEMNTNENFSLLINKSRSPIDECVLNEPLTQISRNSPLKEVSDIITKKIKSTRNLMSYIEEIRRENDIIDFTPDPERDYQASFIEFNGNPFVKKRYGIEDHISSKQEEKTGFLTFLENNMQNDANENPQSDKFRIDLTRTSPTEHNHTDLLSSTKEIESSFTYNSDKHLLQKETLNSQVNSTFINASCNSSNKMDTDDDPDVHTKNKRKLDDNNDNATCLSASKKHKNDTTKIEIYEIKNTKAIASNSDEVENEVEICAIVKNQNSYQDKDNFNEQETDLWNYDYSEILNVVFPEISDIKNKHVSPLKSTTPNSIVLSSSSEVSLDSQDINDFNRNENISVVRSNLHDSDEEFRYNLSNDINFSNINIDDKIKHIVLLDKNALHVISRKKILKRKWKSEENLRMNYMTEENDQNNKENNNKLFITNKLFTITENDDTSPPNYNIMNTPEHHKEMEKYGLKNQSRNKTIKLLTYIYNELHPTIDLCETMNTNTQKINNAYEKSQKKRQNADISSSDEDNNTEYECSTTLLKKWDSNYDKRIESSGKSLYMIENFVKLDDCVNMKEAFAKLMEFNKDLHNKILQYEPLNVKWLYQLLKTSGFKCKINDVIDFLDEQCITFNIPENKMRNRSRK
ncbi:PREDICTED: GRIP and coiled-coil domain-containing protein PFC0235w-like isoform X2 [Polistes dominula]|uniref:Structure-specific endonuclease subunit SLX4 n=1 Tax=Polistes dominula TaxID=743375 RepID=A0ABM1IFB7_POLDO|nr:PREDICTED: GRIP and coiled-coil domain-containing protein PFC0235w-like isoform X2 [Polistes dominula]